MKGLFSILLSEKLEVNWETRSWLCGKTQWSESALINPMSDPQWHTTDNETGFINFCISQKLPFSFLKVAQIDHCIVEQIQYKIKLWIIYDSACKPLLKNFSNAQVLQRPEKSNEFLFVLFLQCRQILQCIVRDYSWLEMTEITFLNEKMPNLFFTTLLYFFPDFIIIFD